MHLGGGAAIITKLYAPPPPPKKKKDAVCAIRLATPSYDDVMSYPLAG